MLIENFLLLLYRFSQISTVILILIGFTGCSQRPSNQQLETWRQEAVQANLKQSTEHQKQQFKLDDWELTIQGQIKSPTAIRFNWSQLETLAKTYVKTKSPHNTENLTQILEFRGIEVSQLLKQANIASTVQEITFIGFDSYRATVQRSDLENYPIIIALERDGKPIRRSEGGPLFLVFPQQEYPRLKQQYSDAAWVFYVTHIIAGTERANLRIKTSPLQPETEIPDSHRFQGSELDQLEQITIKTPVGYKPGWSIGQVQLEGVRVRDLLKSAGVQLSPTGSVVVRGKSHADQELETPIRLDAALILNCDILIAQRWRDPLKPAPLASIPAKLGGPLTLAFPSDCPSEPRFTQFRNDGRYWVTFVEALEVE